MNGTTNDDYIGYDIYDKNDDKCFTNNDSDGCL